MRRLLIQTPAHRPGHRRTSGIQQNRHPYTSTRNGSRRLSSGGSAARSQHDGDTAQARFTSSTAHASSRGFEVEGVSARKLSEAVYASHANCDFFGVSHTGRDVATVSILNGGACLAQPILPPSSQGFGVLGISGRHLSSEAIQALPSRRGNHSFFGGPAADSSEDVMLNPFLDSVPEVRNKNQGPPSDAVLDLFKTISTLNRKPTKSAADLPVLDGENNVGEMESCEPEGEIIGIPGIGSLIADEEVQKATPGKTKPKEYANEAEREKHAMSCRLNPALKEDPFKARNFNKVMDLFKEGRYSPHELLTLKQIDSIFRYTVKSDLIAGYDVLKYFVARYKEQGRLVPLNVYYPLFKGFLRVPLRPQAASRRNLKLKPWPLTVNEVQHLLEDVTQHIREEYSEGKKMVYQYLLLPELAFDLYSNQNPFVNSFAKPIIEHILDSDFPLLNPELFELILEGATHDKSGPDGLPYHRILSHLVLIGNRPKPETVVNVLHCYYPFTNTEATHEVLSIIQKLHTDNNFSLSEAEDYRVGLGVLESISKASTRINIDLNLLVWDVVELFGYNSTESLFEDVIMSFAARRQHENMYTALVDMEINGFKPSRALLRYVALKVGFDQKSLEHAQKMLARHEKEHVRSTHTMNTVMMAHGMKRDINSAFLVYEDLPRFNLQPDANTFCILMETLYIDTKERFPYQAKNPPTFSPQDIEDVVGAAQIILDAMEEAGIGKTSHFCHEHIRVLCALGLLDDANEVLQEALHSGMTVPMQSLFLLATRFTDRGESEKAFAVAERSVAAGCGELPQLYNRIRNIIDGKKCSPEK